MRDHGSNGLSVQENLKARQSKRVFETNAEPPQSKCPWHPTKRIWEDPLEAVKEAIVRSEVTPGIVIVAVKCEGCGFYHLTKRDNAKPGTTVTLEDITGEKPVEPDAEDEGPVLPYGPDARQKVLRQYLTPDAKPTTDELLEVVGLSTHSRGVLSRDMRAIGWDVKKGPGAYWFPKVAVEGPKTEPIPGMPEGFWRSKSGETEDALPVATDEAVGGEVPASVTLDPPIPVSLSAIEHLSLRDVAAVLRTFGFNLVLEAVVRDA